MTEFGGFDPEPPVTDPLPQYDTGFAGLLGPVAPLGSYGPLAAIDADGIQAVLNQQGAYLGDLMARLGTTSTGLPSWETALLGPAHPAGDTAAVLELTSTALRDAALLADTSTAWDEVGDAFAWAEDAGGSSRALLGSIQEAEIRNDIFAGPSAYWPA